MQDVGFSCSAVGSVFQSGLFVDVCESTQMNEAEASFAVEQNFVYVIAFYFNVTNYVGIFCAVVGAYFSSATWALEGAV